MRDQRNAGGEEAWIVGGARNFLAKFRGEFAEHRRHMDADLFETRPFIIAMTPPPPGAPLWSVRLHGVRVKRPAARSANGAPAGSASSTASKAATIRSRNVSNQAFACSLRCSIFMIGPRA